MRVSGLARDSPRLMLRSATSVFAGASLAIQRCAFSEKSSRTSQRFAQDVRDIWMETSTSSANTQLLQYLNSFASLCERGSAPRGRGGC